jgi:hypothetical protein
LRRLWKADGKWTAVGDSLKNYKTMSIIFIVSALILGLRWQSNLKALIYSSGQ